MISLTKRLKSEKSLNDTKKDISRVSIRDKLLIKEVQEMEQNLPRDCTVRFEDPNRLHDFLVCISPDEGLYTGGVFIFHVKVPLDYNMSPPEVKCLTKLWHPNINEDGEICLSLLRQNSGMLQSKFHQFDGHGWAPTRRIKDVVWGLYSLFDDLLNFDDPLNLEAAEHFQADQTGFRSKVRDYIDKYAKG